MLGYDNSRACEIIALPLSELARVLVRFNYIASSASARIQTHRALRAPGLQRRSRPTRG